MSLSLGIYKYSRLALLPFFPAFKLLFPMTSIPYKCLHALGGSFHLLSQLSPPWLFPAQETTAAPLLLLKRAVHRSRGHLSRPVTARVRHGIHLPSGSAWFAPTPNQNPYHLSFSWPEWECYPMNEPWEQPSNWV